MSFSKEPTEPNDDDLDIFKEILEQAREENLAAFDQLAHAATSADELIVMPEEEWPLSRSKITKVRNY